MILDGKRIAKEIQQEVATEIKNCNLQPSLAVILVGDDAASQIYVERKRKICREVGINGELYKFSATAAQEEIENCIRTCTADGILVQLPLPDNLNKFNILNSIPPDKDVDCFTSVNIGKLAQGIGVLRPCTPTGILEILKRYEIPTQGKRIAIINRTLVVGCPLAVMLQQEPYNATVTICHEYTKDLFSHTLKSDIVITAVGKYPKFELYPVWIRKGSTVIDVAMNRIDGKLFGDVVEFDAAKEKAGYITPVPGSVGPMTVAMLMRNTLLCTKLQRRRNT